MVRCDGHGRLCQQDDGGPEQDAGRDGGEGDDSHHPECYLSNALALYLLVKVGMLFRFIATGIGGFVYPFTQVEIQGKAYFTELLLLRTGFSPWFF